MWSHLYPAAYMMYVITLPSSMPPSQITQHIHREHLRSVYFRYQVHFLLFLFPVSDFRRCLVRGQKGLQINIQHTDEWNSCIFHLKILKHKTYTDVTDIKWWESKSFILNFVVVYWSLFEHFFDLMKKSSMIMICSFHCIYMHWNEQIIDIYIYIYI